MWKVLEKHKPIVALIVVFVAIKILYLLKPHFVGWDEAVYLGMGKFIYSLGNVGLWEDIRPIGLPLMLGAFWKLKFDYVLFSEILIGIFSVGNIILVYLLGRKLFNEMVGIFSSILLAFTPIFFSHSSSIMTSIPSTFLVLTALYFYVLRKNFFWVGIFLGLSLLFRFPQGIALAVFILLIFISTNPTKKKIIDLAYLAGGFFIVLLPFVSFNYILYNQYTGNIIDALFRPFILGSLHGANPFHQEGSGFYFKTIFFQNFLFLFSLFGVFVSLKKKVLSLIALPLFYVFYFSSIANKQSRFLLIFLPYVCLLTGVGLYEIYIILKRRNKFSVVSVILLVVFIAVSFVPVVKNDYLDYAVRSPEEHSSVLFFKGFNSLEGPILTTHPVPVAYSDVLFIPHYDNPEIALKFFDTYEDEAKYILYFPDFYPCLDKKCESDKKMLDDKITKHELISQIEIWDSGYLLFKVT